MKCIKYALVIFVAIIVATIFVFLKTPHKYVTEKCTIRCDKVSGIVVPHHEMVAYQRAIFLDKLVEKIKKPETVIIVSPNHYSLGYGAVQTTDKVWEFLDGGAIHPNTEVINSISANHDSVSFKSEHGVYSVLPDINRVFPDARIIPILLKNDIRQEELDRLFDDLLKSCSECLMVASVDFSHYQPAILAQEHDRLSIRGLQKLDIKLIRERAEVDTSPSLEFLMRWAIHNGTERFELVDHTNSGLLLRDQDIETTTHLFGWYTEGARVVPEPRVSFLIGGDVMFARGIHYAFESNLEEVVENLGDRVFWGTDAGIVNLEGAISATAIEPDPGPHFKFVFPPETVELLENLNINAVSLDNNHANNAGPVGEKITSELLSKRGIQTIKATFEGEKLKLTVIGIHTLWGVEDITEEIKEIKKDTNQRVIIMPHWGVEYEPVHSKSQQTLAHKWIDAGADAVIGSHPHVIQDAELYKGKPIIYSLGNLIFDQDWSVATQQGMLIGGAFTEDGIELFGLPVISKNYKPELARGAIKRQLLKKIESVIINL